MALQTYNQVVGSGGQNLGTSPDSADAQNAKFVSELNARFYQLTYQSKVFTGGMVLTGINNATFTTATVGATATPVIGVWNPSTSTVNLIILQAVLGVTITAATATGAGPFAWMASTGNTATPTGSTPLNRKTFAASGSQAKFYAGTALTGLTTNLAILCGSALNGGSAEGYSFVSTAVGAQSSSASGSVENFDGSLIVPPGGVIGLFAAATPVAHSATSGIVWAELPL